MGKYQLSFWFEHGGYCVWGKNEKAKEKYGYAIDSRTLPISKDLLNDLNDLEEEFARYLDWDCPQNPSPWTVEHKTNFLHRATLACEKLRYELGSDFEIVNEVAL